MQIENSKGPNVWEMKFKKVLSSLFVHLLVSHFQRREKFKILYSAYVHNDALPVCQRLQTNLTMFENI